MEKWTWEEILDGKGPWEQPGDYCRPKAELEAAKAERRHYEELARQSGWKPEIQTQTFLGGRLTGSMATPGRRPEPTSCGYWGARETGQAPCYAVVRTVSPVRVHSPVRYIPAPRIGLARVGIELGSMSPRAGVHGTILKHGVPGSRAQPSAGYSTSPHWQGDREYSTR